MDKVVNKFYTGNMTNFGFGTWNSIPSYPKKNNNNNFDRTMQVSVPAAPALNYLNTVRPLSQINPMPKTLLSMNNSNYNNNYNNSNYNIPYNNNYDNYHQSYLSPENLKMQMLEQKIKNLEMQNEDDKMNFKNMMEKIQSDNEMDYQNQINKMQNQIKNLHPKELYENPYENNLDDNYELKRLERRKQIQYELEQAREKLNEGNSSSEYEGEEEEDEEDEDPKFRKRKNSSLPSSVDRRNTNYSKISSSKKKNTNNNNNSGFKSGNRMVNQSNILSNHNEDHNDFMNKLPKHVALQLQSDNFKVRANLASIKNSFREIKNELESKLEHLENTQKLNYESIRNVIEQGGTDKLRASIKKNIDGKDINLDQFEEEMPGYMNELPEMIDKRILENEEKRREDEIREINEENNMREEENLILPPIGNIKKDPNEKLIPGRVGLPSNNYNNFDLGHEKNPYKFNRKNQNNNDNVNYMNPVVDRKGNLDYSKINPGKVNLRDINKIADESEVTVSKQTSEKKSESEISKSEMSQSVSQYSKSQKNKKDDKKNKKKEEE